MKLDRIALLLASGLAVGGCSEAWSHSFVRTDPPATARGVSVALVGRQCDRQVDPNWQTYADVLGLDVDLRVTNSGAAAMTFDPAKVRLLADGRARAPHRSDSAETIASGASRSFTVHFLEHDDNLACNVPMTLAVGDAAEIGSTPVPLGPLGFLASRHDI